MTTENTNTTRRSKRAVYAPGTLVRALIPNRRSLRFTGVIEAHGKFRINDAGEAVEDDSSSESLYVVRVTEAPEAQYADRTFLLGSTKILGTVEELRVVEEERENLVNAVETTLTEEGINFRKDSRQKNPAWILDGTFSSAGLRQIADLMDSESFTNVCAKVQINTEVSASTTTPNVTATDVFGDTEDSEEAA